MIAGRFILLLLSFKYLNICRFYIHYEWFYLAVECLLPHSTTLEARYIFCTRIAWRCITLYCCDFWRTCITVIIPMATYEIMAMVHQAESYSSVFHRLIASYVCVFITLAIVRVCVILPGKLFIDNTVMRRGNKKLLNSLKESVIVAHRESGDVIFANKATAKINTHFV